MLAFHHFAGQWPIHITIITHSFKTERFINLHLPALRYERKRVLCGGLNPPAFLERDYAHMDAIEQAERENGYNLWSKDPYGRGRELNNKRKARSGGHMGNAGMEWPGYTRTKQHDCTSEGRVYPLDKFLEWMGGPTGEQIYPYPLPWDMTPLPKRTQWSWPTRAESKLLNDPVERNCVIQNL